MLKRQHNVNERVKFLARLMMLETLGGTEKSKAALFGVEPASYSRLKTGIETSGTMHVLMDYVYKKHFSTEPNADLENEARKKIAAQIGAKEAAQLKHAGAKHKTQKLKRVQSLN